MSLGIAVHNVIENLINFKSEDRKNEIQNKLIHNFEIGWDAFSGKKGGFKDDTQETEFKNRGIQMLQKVIEDPKMLINKTIPTKSYYDGDMLPNVYLSEQENIILCGNIDWIEYLDSSNSLRVIDFKTGNNEEKEESNQLYIYRLLIEKLGCKWPVTSGAYWYLNSGKIVERPVLDDAEQNDLINKLIEIGVDIRNRRFAWDERKGWIAQKDIESNFKCKKENGCIHCKDYERVIRNENIEYIGIDQYGKDSYFLN
jgi:hypothetical protein